MMQARTLSVTESGRLGELYERHAPEAVRLGYLITGDAALAEDLVQDAFVKLLGRFRDLRNPVGWTVAIGAPGEKGDPWRGER